MRAPRLLHVPVEKRQCARQLTHGTSMNIDYAASTWKPPRICRERSTLVSPRFAMPTIRFSVRPRSTRHPAFRNRHTPRAFPHGGCRRTASGLARLTRGVNVLADRQIGTTSFSKIRRCSDQLRFFSVALDRSYSAPTVSPSNPRWQRYDVSPHLTAGLICLLDATVASRRRSTSRGFNLLSKRERT